MEILFIGGTGVISSACTRLAVERGLGVTHLNRGNGRRPVPASVETLVADIRDPGSVRTAIGDRRFDAVVDWIAFTEAQIETAIDLWAERTRQYVFISSASAYQTPPIRLPVTEETPLDNPFWLYSRNKIACERRLTRAFAEDAFPATIVRPSHTYDPTLVPLHGGWTVVDRMRRGRPVVVHGDGSSLWVLTHHTDFAVGLVGLLDRFDTVGETFQIMSNELLSWDRITHLLAEAAGCEAEIVHVPSDVIAAYDPDWGDSLLGDKTHSMIFDCSKIRAYVPEFDPKIPFDRGAREIVEWYDADASRRIVNDGLNRVLDDMIDGSRRSRP